jgi:hypothetical protein
LTKGKSPPLEPKRDFGERGASLARSNWFTSPQCSGDRKTHHAPRFSAEGRSGCVDKILIQYRRAPEACGLLVSNPQIAAAATVTDVIILLLREILL